MIIKIGKEIAINPKHTVFIALQKETLNTVVGIIGGQAVVSEFTFDETIKILNQED